MLGRRLVDALTMFSVAALSLVLLIYVGFGTAQRTYERFYTETALAQGQLVQSAMEGFLRPGLPMRQFAGFATLTDPMVSSDPFIASIAAFDQDGQLVFGSGDTSVGILPARTAAAAAAAAAAGGAAPGDLRESEAHHQVILPLRSRFEVVGSLAVTVPRAVIRARVEDAFASLLWVAGAASLAFALFVALGGPRLHEARTPWVGVAFAATFLGVAALVAATLGGLYTDGAQAKGRALANSLGQRLGDIAAFNLNFDEIDGLDRVFGEYRRLNPDISAGGLSVGGRVLVHTDPAQRGSVWTSDPATFEYVVDISPPGGHRTVQVALAMPKSVVYRQVGRSARSFLALFVASGFFAYFFMNMARSLRRRGAQDGRNEAAPRDLAALGLVKPVFFLAVLVEHLNYAFLPQYVHGIAGALDLPPALVSAPFMGYYLCFAAALIPAGRYEARLGSHRLIWIGLLLAAAGLLALAAWPDFLVATAARCISGAGQGMLFIGVQSYILAKASPDRRTRGAGIIVLGFQAGMISGMAIGSLLVSQLGPRGVFALGAAVATLAAVYSTLLVPRVAPAAAATAGGEAAHPGLWRGVGSMLGDLRFLKTMGLIGVPAKAVLTGVILFALPLLLAGQGFAQEDIGQITMVYAGSVMAASLLVSRLADLSGNTRPILFWGSTISGAGLFLTSLAGWAASAQGAGGGPALAGVLVTLGVAIVGVAHGFINAPVVTHVAEAEVSARLGAGHVAATYRLLERLGHTAGPIIVGQIFARFGQEPAVLGWIGGAIILFGILFLAPAGPGNAARLQAEAVR